MSYTYTDKIKFAYTTNFDAFGRLRTSSPLTLFDSSHRFRDNGLWATSLTGSGTKTFNSNDGSINMNVTTASGDKVVRETYRVFSYQPGKSLLILNTFTFAESQSGLKQRVGYFGQNNGFYLELDDSTISLVKRSYVSGTVNNTPVDSSSWNVDPMDGSGPSGITLDLTKSQILWIDLEWLGVGSVRCGFVINGEFYTCHVFNHANLITSTYITTACLPVRYEIENTSNTSSSSTLKQICSSVISEGGYELRGEPRSIDTGILTPYNLVVAGTYYPVASIMLKSGNLDSVVIPSGIDIQPQDNGNYSWKIFVGGTTTGGSWTTLDTNSSVNYNITGSSFSGGSCIKTGYFSASAQSKASVNIDRNDIFQNQLLRDGLTETALEFTICVCSETVPGGGGGNQVWAAINWEEITK